MTPQSVVLSSYEAFVTSQNDLSEAEDRAARLLTFPYPVMLELSCPELAFANRWCWQQFGPAFGECYQAISEYCACTIADRHCHVGDWMWHWFGKTDYDFGFCEWYFKNKAQYESFLASVPAINWGEKYPK